MVWSPKTKRKKWDKNASPASIWQLDVILIKLDRFFPRWNQTRNFALLPGRKVLQRMYAFQNPRKQQKQRWKECEICSPSSPTQTAVSWGNKKIVCSPALMSHCAGEQGTGIPFCHRQGELSVPLPLRSQNMQRAASCRLCIRGRGHENFRQMHFLTIFCFPFYFKTPPQSKWEDLTAKESGTRRAGGWLGVVSGSLMLASLYVLLSFPAQNLPLFLKPFLHRC